MGLVGCDHRDGTSVDRDTFIAVYVDLRATALRSGQAPLDDSARARILAAHGVEERDLRRFADDHGADLAFVRDLWNEVEARFDSIRPTLPRPPD